MNKLTKAAIAGAAGIALLLGGGGSLALWNATGTVNAGSINTGTLTMTVTGGAWNSAPTKWVPGDSYKYTATVDVTAVGDNIKGTLSIDPSTVVIPAALGTDLTITLAVTGTLPTNVTYNAGTGTYDIAAAGTYVLPVEVTAAFKSTSLNGTQGQVIDLTGLAFRVDQHL